MAKIRIGTFNIENLFARFTFRKVRARGPDGKYLKTPEGKYVYRDLNDEELRELVKDGWAADKRKFHSFEKNARDITAKALKGIKADVLGLQEVESMDTLKRFVSEHLKRKGYKYKIVIDGNDPRLIDVALLSKHPFDYVRTYQFIRTKNNKSFLFSRDCLEVGVRISKNKVLPVFVNHFKSLMGGRAETMGRRRLQSEKVVEILKERFGNNPGDKEWVVLGDLNDYLPSTGLEPLLGQPWLENVVDRMPEANDRWTHYYKGKKQYKQLDYILLPKKLADANPGSIPEIERRGLPERATKYSGPRFSGVGKDEPKASDHCPLVIELSI